MKETNRLKQPTKEWEENNITLRLYRRQSQKGNTLNTFSLTRKWIDTKGKTKITHGFYENHIETIINLLFKAQTEIKSKIGGQK